METILSVSIVVYQPKIDLLDKVFYHLRLSIDGFLKKRSREKIIVSIVDNKPEAGYKTEINKILQKNFSSAALINTEIVDNPGNPGYAHGNNKIMLKSNATFHLVMNPDVFVESSTLLDSIEFLENNLEVGLLSPAVFGCNGERHYLCKQNPSLVITFLRRFAPKFIHKIFKSHLDLFEMKDWNYNEVIWDVPNLTGCFMFFRSKAAKQVNGFDERFFMYCEDADITRRILNAGYRTIYVPFIKIKHIWARDSYHNYKLMWANIFSSFKYWWKWRNC